MLKIFYDEIQEGQWFRNLHPVLQDVELEAITGATSRNPKLSKILKYDRPDVILTDNNVPILVVERTIEVPSGHNVGQRFGRIAAASEAGLPFVYFGPYAARKHGGETEGPRYMNLRLFHSLDNMSRINNTAIVTINWPVDKNYEIVKGTAKDARMKEFLELFFNSYFELGLSGINYSIMHSQFQREQLEERKHFARTKVTKPEQYNIPPDSVKIIGTSKYLKQHSLDGRLQEFSQFNELVVYTIGMKYIRSDPYTGMAMLYRYLYQLNQDRGMILEMPNITSELWDEASHKKKRKDIRIYKMVADGILFGNKFVSRAELDEEQ